jgi:hypothetical protein
MRSAVIELNPARAGLFLPDLFHFEGFALTLPLRTQRHSLSPRGRTHLVSFNADQCSTMTWVSSGIWLQRSANIFMAAVLSPLRNISPIRWTSSTTGQPIAAWTTPHSPIIGGRSAAAAGLQQDNPSDQNAGSHGVWPSSMVGAAVASAE